MGFLDWLGISARDAPQVTDSVRDSGQTFVFGKADSGEKVDEKSAMQIATVYACVRLLAETVAGLPLHLYRFSAYQRSRHRDFRIGRHLRNFLCHRRRRHCGRHLH